MSKLTQRKQRIVKNALVCTSDVDIIPGTDYINWIPIARNKLKVNYCTLHKYIHTNRLKNLNVKGARICIIGSKINRNTKYYQGIPQ